MKGSCPAFPLPHEGPEEKPSSEAWDRVLTRPGHAGT